MFESTPLRSVWRPAHLLSIFVQHHLLEDHLGLVPQEVLVLKEGLCVFAMLVTSYLDLLVCGNKVCKNKSNSLIHLSIFGQVYRCSDGIFW